MLCGGTHSRVCVSHCWSQTTQYPRHHTHALRAHVHALRMREHTSFESSLPLELAVREAPPHASKRVNLGLERSTRSTFRRRESKTTRISVPSSGEAGSWGVFGTHCPHRNTNASAVSPHILSSPARARPGRSVGRVPIAGLAMSRQYTHLRPNTPLRGLARDCTKLRTSHWAECCVSCPAAHEIVMVMRESVSPADCRTFGPLHAWHSIGLYTNR